MQKPQNYKEAAKLLGRKAIVTYEDAKPVTGAITGINTAQGDRSMGAGEEFVNFWVYLNGKPRSYPYHRVEIIEEPVTFIRKKNTGIAILLIIVFAIAMLLARQGLPHYIR